MQSSVDGITMHHYYVNGRTTDLEEVLNPKITFDALETKIQEVVNISCGKDVWLTESGSARGGGAPDISNRFVAGFLLLDRLGVAVRNGVKVVNRQSFLSGKYAMVNVTGGYVPYPDFYLSVLFKRLVSSRVFNAQVVGIDGEDGKFRVYAHCAQRSNPGSIVVIVLNIHDVEKCFTFKNAGSEKIEAFILKPGEPGNLQSSTVRLNGVLLQMHGNELPRMNGQLMVEMVAVMQPFSFGFFIVRDYESTICN